MYSYLLLARTIASSTALVDFASYLLAHTSKQFVHIKDVNTVVQCVRTIGSRFTKRRVQHVHAQKEASYCVQQVYRALSGTHVSQFEVLWKLPTAYITMCSA